MIDSIPLPWPIHKSSELGPDKDKSNWRKFSNAEHENVFHFKDNGGEGQRQQRCDMVSKRWNIYQDPANALKASKSTGDKVKLFLVGPTRAPVGGFTKPSLEKGADKAKAEQFEKDLQGMYAKMEAAKRLIVSEMEEAQKPKPVRAFDLVRKPSLDSSITAVLPYEQKPEDYVLVYKDLVPRSAPTANGSPSKRRKIVQADTRYQTLLKKAEKQWDLVPPALDFVFGQVQGFLHPEPAVSVDAAGDDEFDFGTVRDFVYEQPDDEPSPDESDVQTSLVLEALFSMGSVPESEGIDAEALFAQVKQNASDSGEVDDVAAMSTEDFMELLGCIQELGLVEWDASLVSLTAAGSTRIETELRRGVGA